MNNRKSVLIALVGIPFIASAVHADVQVSPLFADNMVLQRNLAVPIWGTADAGEAVTVTMAGQTEKTVATPEGKWSIKLKPLKAAESLSLTITGKNTINIQNIAVGEVWLASGQSNMEWIVTNSNNAQAESAASADPLLRMFTVKKLAVPEVQTTVSGDWQAAAPATTPRFSAVGYFFARELRKKLNVPVGIIHTSWGGTPAQAWTSRKALETNADLKTQLLDPADKVAAAYPAALEKYNAETIPAWEKAVEEAKAAGRAIPQKPRVPRGGPGDGSASTYLFNGMVAPLVPYGIKGAIWYQGESNAGNAKQYQVLFPAMIKDWRAHWNQGGFPFGFVQLANFYEQQLAPIEEGWAGLREAQLKTLSLPNTGMASAIDVGEAYDIHPRNKQDVGNRLALWALNTVYGQKNEYSGPIYDSMKVEGNKIRLRFKHIGGGLTTKDNSARINDEVARRSAAMYPHLDVLASAGLLVDTPIPYTAQTTFTRRQIAQIVAGIDAKLAAANDLNLDTTEINEKSDRAKVKTALTELRRLVAPQIVELTKPAGSALRGFAIAGADKKWVWGNAVIDKDTVVVSSPDVPNPTAVRYAWANNPNGNLYNKADLPASPFRTDIEGRQ
jgi:sialate O-acetylesterase